ncbi:glycosyltransferase [Salipaludibacillus agaradhaerens]|jgi:glycosyltransferase involved in cell wall biosynthesis|uniref:Glycosyltransferase n=1 Tax=Salipaludibacillus agaradhaerens TaxID=76935 RepID=A0A9Q4AY51_SALAG|nr:glycosyltransferase [Salipaludibacillus agaradhaerens]MCR6094929.1 glycosyltransferase [Salipaludibacillus agaradhaerens]MCR6115513.1 glycosyltransferase [Salipaludibacillus agaradhaerens]
MKKTKLTVLFYIYRMGGGGAARTLLNIINNLDRSKFQPILVTLDYEGSYEKELESDVLHLKLNTRRLSRSAFKLAKTIRNYNVDIVFSTIPRVNTIAIMANIFSGKKAKNVVREADNLGGAFVENFKLKLFGIVYKFSDQIVSLSEGVKDNLVEKYNIKSGDIKVIYNPLDLNRIDVNAREEVPFQFKPLFEKREPVLINAGRLVKQKDQETLLKAFALVNKEIKSQLIILGDGPLKENLVRLGKDLGVHERLTFAGFQLNPYSFMKNADLFVLSSRHEGFSHVIAEALATETPVVATDCKSGPSEVLDRGKFGCLSKVGDEKGLAKEMIKVLKLTDEQRRIVVEQGRYRAEDFEAKKIVKEYEEVFLSVTKKI